jgi:Mlc titration factor MtfA (ptsG expression regulator)
VNVVIHEFAHKLDMLNGGANGYPPLHRGMSREGWSRALGSAYQDFCERVDRDQHTLIDPYASESPGEFFAVVSEAFFETPALVRDQYPAVFEQLRQFYRQDPAARLRAQVAVTQPPADPNGRHAAGIGSAKRGL